jgi:hypothetical protein
MRRPTTLFAALAALAAIPVALLGFFLHLRSRTGELLASVHAQEEFGRSMSLDGPYRAISNAVTSISNGALGTAIELAAAFGIAVAIVAFAAVAVGDRWEIRGWTAFAALSLLMPLATGLVWQMPRFALLIPPVFWMLGVIARRPALHLALLITLPMALTFKVVFDVVGVSQ